MPLGLIEGCAVKSGLLLFVTTNVTVWLDTSFGGPSRIDVAQPETVWGPAFSSSIRSAPLVKLGGSLTAVTLIVNACDGLSALPIRRAPLS